MSKDNVSFTFLHRIEEVELNIEDGRWQSACISRSSLAISFDSE